MTLRKSTFAPLSRIFAFAIELDGVDRVLSVVRRHLGMDVAFVARFREEDRVLEHVDESTAGVIFQHQKIPLSEGYCQKVVNGELPELIPDTSLLAAAQEIPETHTIPIGSPPPPPLPPHPTRLSVPCAPRATSRDRAVVGARARGGAGAGAGAPCDRRRAWRTWRPPPRVVRCLEALVGGATWLQVKA